MERASRYNSTMVLDSPISIVKRIRASGATISLRGDSVAISPRQPDDIAIMVAQAKPQIIQILKAEQWIDDWGSKPNWDAIGLIWDASAIVEDFKLAGHDTWLVEHNLYLCELYAGNGGTHPSYSEMQSSIQKMISDGPLLSGKALSQAAKRIMEDQPAINMSALD